MSQHPNIVQSRVVLLRPLFLPAIGLLCVHPGLNSTERIWELEIIDGHGLGLALLERAVECFVKDRRIITRDAFVHDELATRFASRAFHDYGNHFVMLIATAA